MSDFSVSKHKDH